MSLLGRVEAATGTASLRAATSQRTLDDLRSQVQVYVSVDDIASIMVSNPQLARNELKSACRQVFESPFWAETPNDEKQALEKGLLDEVFGFGPLQPFLDDESVTEIMVNGPQSVFFEREGCLYPCSRVFSDENQLRALVDRILGPLGRRVDESSPMVNARLPQGHRVHAIIPPIALDGPILTIRKFTRRVMTLEDMVQGGSFDQTILQFLKWAVRMRKSIAVSGGTGSGKTTLLNALSCALPLDERIITIEDSAELRFLEHPHVVRLEARTRNAEGLGEVGIRELVINALRMRPDRIVVGECRGDEAIDMLQAMNTGHDGSMTTLHANSTRDAVSRLTTMVRYSVDLPVDVIEANIASALDVVVQTSRSLEGRRFVSEISEFCFNEKTRMCEVVPLFVREGTWNAGKWLRAPEWLSGVCQRDIARDEEVNRWLRQTSLQR